MLSHTFVDAQKEINACLDSKLSEPECEILKEKLFELLEAHISGENPSQIFLDLFNYYYKECMSTTMNNEIFLVLDTFLLYFPKTLPNPFHAQRAILEKERDKLIPVGELLFAFTNMRFPKNNMYEVGQAPIGTQPCRTKQPI